MNFDKVQIQVGEVIKCEPVPKAKKHFSFTD